MKSKPFIEERYAVILKLIKEEGRVTVSDLCLCFSVTVATVRSDLDELEKRGKIRRTHGGALATDTENELLPFGPRLLFHGDAKNAIGRAAAEIVKDGEVIFVDGGTTAAAMRFHLADRPNITILTPSLEVAYWISTNTTIEVYMFNGFLERGSLGTIGVPPEEVLARMNIMIAFCGAAGFTLDDGLTDLNMGFVEQKRVICKHARKVFGVVDHTKFGITSLASFARIDSIHGIVTDRPPPADMLAELARRQIQVVIAAD